MSDSMEHSEEIAEVSIEKMDTDQPEDQAVVELTEKVQENNDSDEDLSGSDVEEKQESHEQHSEDDEKHDIDENHSEHVSDDHHSEDEEKHESDDHIETEEKEDSGNELTLENTTVDDSLTLNVSSLKSEDSMEESIEEEKESLDDSTVSTKRNRKKVERFVQEVKTKEKDEEVVEIKGDGIKLGSVTYIETMISRTSADDLRALHRIMFNRPGTHNEVKRNLRKFNGFSLDKDSKDYEKKLKKLEKLTLADLKKMLTVLGLEKRGTKPEITERILEFVNCPVDKGQKLPGKKKSKAKKSKPKTVKDQKAKNAKSPKEKKVTEKKKKVEVKPVSESDSDADSSSSEEEEVQPPPPPPVKKATPKKVAKPTNKTPAKKRKADEPPAIKTPASKKKKDNPPTDVQIKALIKKILEKANLEEVTMKKVCQQVYDNYPSHNLVYKKEFIKDTVKTILS